MNQHHTEQRFKNDDRLSQLDPERLSALMACAKELSDAPKEQKMTTFLAINKRASEGKISFTPEERDLLISVLTENMSEEEKKRVELIRNLASKLSGPRT